VTETGSRGGGDEGESSGMSTPIRLPWGVVRERAYFPDSVRINTNVKPGEFILQTLFAEFTVLAARKIDQALEPPVRYRMVLSQWLKWF